eukprot:364496-Chlamydomonas_euryale.AAC.13
MATLAPTKQPTRKDGYRPENIGGMENFPSLKGLLGFVHVAFGTDGRGRTDEDGGNVTTAGYLKLGHQKMLWQTPELNVCRNNLFGGRLAHS